MSFKFSFGLWICRLESKFWQEQHTKKVLEEEKKKFVQEIGLLKTENAKTDRQIKQAKTFTS